MAYNPTTIGNYFITTYGSRYVPLTVPQLIGLVYYSYGWYLAFSEGKATLIKEPLVCRRGCAVFDSLWENMLDSGVNRFYKKVPNRQGNQTISKEDQHLLDRIWNTYGHHRSAISRLAFFKEDNPWRSSIIRGHSIVPMLKVYEHFKAKLTTAGTTAA